jgi:hypothetical protein
MSVKAFSALGYNAFKQDPQGVEEDARGFTAFAQQGLLRIARIALNKNADLSTFLHESAHVFLELFGDLAERDDAPDQVRDDYAKALKWMGVEKRSEVQREHHEKWARGFERYLFEGKAPSVALAGAFQRFKSWLKTVYRSIASLDVELNDDVRGVFDRLLATDREIDLMQRRMGIAAPLFASPAEMAKVMGREVSAEEWAAYLDEYQQAHSHAARQLELRVMKDRLRASEAWWKEETRRMQDVARAEYEALPGRLAHQFLWGKAMPGTEMEGLLIHLDRAKVEAVVGPENARLFPLRKKGGADPGEVAGLTGFQTGEEMLKAVAELPEKDVWVKDRAESAMREKYPELLDERDKLREEVAKGLHGDHTMAWLARELRRWARRRTSSRSARTRARRRRSPGPAPRRGQRPQAGAGRGEQRAEGRHDGRLREGGLVQAAAALQHGAAPRAHEGPRGARGVRGPRRGARQAHRAGPAREGRRRLYRDGVDLLLQTFALAAETARETPFPSVDQVAAAMEADGATVMFDTDLVGALVKRGGSWKDLTVTEMRAVKEALENVQAAARAKNGVLLDGRRVEKAQVVAQLVAEAAAILRDRGPATTKEARRCSSGPSGSATRWTGGCSASSR